MATISLAQNKFHNLEGPARNAARCKEEAFNAVQCDSLVNWRKSKIPVQSILLKILPYQLLELLEKWLAEKYNAIFSKCFSAYVVLVRLGQTFSLFV
jgi:hypothetical protein